MQGRHKCRAWNVLRLRREIFQHVGVRRRPRDAWLGFQKSEAAGGAHARFEVLDICLADLLLLWKAIELRPEHGSLKFAQPVIEADDAALVLVGNAGTPRVDVRLHALEVFQVVGDDATALTAGDELAGLKAESPQIADGSCAFVAPHAAVHMRAILDHVQIMFLRHSHDRVKIRKAHAQMHWQYGARFRRDGLLDQLCVHAIGVRVNVHEHRNGVHQKHRPNRPLPGVGRNQHFVARLNVQGFQCRLDSDGASVHTLGVLGCVELRKFFGKRLGVLTGKRLAAPIAVGQYVVERGTFRVGIDRPGVEALLPDGLATRNRKFSHRDRCSPSLT